MQHSGMPDHDYLATSAQITRETADIGVQRDLGMEEMTELLGLKTKSQNPDAVMMELFVQKVTSSDRNVKQYTGVPSKSILDGLFYKYLIPLYFVRRYSFYFETYLRY